jgi:hypothetical protein
LSRKHSPFAPLTKFHSISPFGSVGQINYEAKMDKLNEEVWPSLSINPSSVHSPCHPRPHQTTAHKLSACPVFAAQFENNRDQQQAEYDGKAQKRADKRRRRKAAQQQKEADAKRQKTDPDAKKAAAAAAPAAKAAAAKAPAPAVVGDTPGGSAIIANDGNFLAMVHGRDDSDESVARRMPTPTPRPPPHPSTTPLTDGNAPPRR